MIGPSERARRLPGYAVSELAAVKRRLMQAGVDVIDLGAGDADLPPPEAAVEALRRAVGDPLMSRYGFQQGLVAFREAVARYMARRFAVTLDPMLEVLPLIGSKDGLAHLPFAVLNQGQSCVVPEPGYPAYIGGAVLSGAPAEIVPLRRDQGFLVELADLPQARLARVGLVYLNYPNNPTAAVAPLEYLTRTVELCRQRRIVVAYDNPYCEIVFDGYRAPSILQVPGARDVAIEFHSLSKTFGMTGWRLGWAVGGRHLIEALSKVKSYVDTGPFLAIQSAGAAVLDRAESIVPPIVQSFRVRRDAAVVALREAGLVVESPRATMYLWVPVPRGVPSAEFAGRLLKEQGVLVVHGSAFGPGGEGFFRVALTVGPERLREAATRVAKGLAGLGVAGAEVAG